MYNAPNLKHTLAQTKTIGSDTVPPPFHAMFSSRLCEYMPFL